MMVKNNMKRVMPKAKAVVLGAMAAGQDQMPPDYDD
jgi:hypothetical protein